MSVQSNDTPQVLGYGTEYQVLFATLEEDSIRVACDFSDAPEVLDLPRVMADEPITEIEQQWGQFPHDHDDIVCLLVNVHKPVSQAFVLRFQRSALYDLLREFGENRKLQISHIPGQLGNMPNSWDLGPVIWSLPYSQPFPANLEKNSGPWSSCPRCVKARADFPEVEWP